MFACREWPVRHFNQRLRIVSHYSEVISELDSIVSRSFEPAITRVVVYKGFAAYECLARWAFTFGIPTTQTILYCSVCCQLAL
jgi:hypothetical protein